MRYSYKGYTIDVTPDFSLGVFFARAQITWGEPDKVINAEMHDSGDLAHFKTEDAAVRFAYQWATEWIDQHQDETLADDRSEVTWLEDDGLPGR